MRKRLAAERVYQFFEGGTGISGYKKGDVIIASGENLLSVLKIGPSGYVFKVVNGVPSWVDGSVFADGISIGVNWLIKESASGNLQFIKGGVLNNEFI